jgi:hypothetical protein
VKKSADMPAVRTGCRVKKKEEEEEPEGSVED